jgi:RNA recognition motif-containing protein
LFSTQESIEAFFNDNNFNPINVNFPKDEKGKIRGFGYVKFSGKEEAKRALNELKNKKIDGTAVIMEFATPPNTSKSLFLGNLFFFFFFFFFFFLNL